MGSRQGLDVRCRREGRGWQKTTKENGKQRAKQPKKKRYHTDSPGHWEGFKQDTTVKSQERKQMSLKQRPVGEDTTTRAPPFPPLSPRHHHSLLPGWRRTKAAH